MIAVLVLASPLQADPSPADLVVIVHPNNQNRVPRLADYFLKKERFWNGDKPIIVFNAPPDSASRVLFDRVVLDLTPEASARYWIDQRIRSGEAPPKEVVEPALIVRLVSKLEGAIAYVPATTVLTGVRVAARIRDGRLISP